MPRFLRGLAATLAISALSACSQASIRTTIGADGSIERSLEFTLAAQPMQGPPKLDDTFVSPGKGWDRKESKKDDNQVFTFTRSFKKGEALGGDFSIKEKIEKPAPKFGEDENKQPEQPKVAKVMLVNEISHKELAPGKWEYVETLRWKGQRDGFAMGKDEQEKVDAFKKKLPEALRTDAVLEKIKKAMGSTASRAVFGPGDPVAPLFLTNPEHAMRKLRSALFGAVVDTLTKEGEGKISKDEATKLARDLLSDFDLQSKVQQNVNETKPKRGAKEEGDKKSKVDMIAMTFSLKVPGTIVETNGQIDAFANEIYWGVYPQAAEFEDVVLRVVYTK